MWVYTSRVSLDTNDTDKEQNKLMDMYNLGDMVDDYQLRNASMKRSIANTRKEIKTLTRQQVHKVYEATMTGSSLRKFIINWLLTGFDRDHIKASIAQELAEFVREFALAALERIELEDDDEVFESLTAMFEPEKDSDRKFDCDGSDEPLTSGLMVVRNGARTHCPFDFLIG